MHHPDPAGDPGSVRKVAHPAVLHGRGSNTVSGSGPTLSTPANSVVNNSHVQVDDYQSSLLIQCQPPAGSPSPGPHHPPPHSLNLLSQPQPTQSAGAQMKKKSGFQITSVTPAQISVSTNNSIAEDTESYDDLDESHTEDLSSSEILDVSLSRANDIAGAERSSSEETLNNFHEAETPGAISPNLPSHHLSLNQAPHHGGTLVNGTVHHHQQGHHPNQAQVNPVSSGSGNTPSALTSGALPCVTQKMPSNMGVPQENVAQSAPQINVAQPLGMVAPGALPGMHSSATGTTVSIANPQTSNVSNVNMLSSTNVPVRGGVSTSATSSSGGFPVSVSSSDGSGCGAFAVGANPMTSPNVNMIQQHQTINSSIAMTTTTNAVGAVSASGVIRVSSGIQGRVASALVHSVGASVSAVATVPVHFTPAHPAPAPTVGTTSSRFRVVKLDSSSEPFKKGRWTCTDYYDKDTPASASSSFASEAVCPSMRQFVPESFAVASERETTSGSSVSSTISTLSHYTESIGSGEAGGPAVPQQAQDYYSPPQGVQALPPNCLSIGVSQTQTPMHPQDPNHVHQKTTVAPSAPTSVHQPAPMFGHQTTIGHPTPVGLQQLTYAQAVSNQPPGSTHGLVGVQQQKQGYASLPQQSLSTPHVAPVQVRPSEYTQPHPAVSQAAVSQLISHQAGQTASAPANRAGQMMGGPRQTQALLHSQPQQTSTLQATTSTLSSHIGVAVGGQQPQSHPSHLDLQQQKQQSLSNQSHNPVLGIQLSSTVHQGQVAATSVPPPSHQSDPQAQHQAHSGGNSGRMPLYSVLQNQPPNIRLSQDHSSAQAQTHTAQASALYASLPNFTTTQLEDAQRLLFQHQSAFLGLPKPWGGEGGTRSGAGPGQEGEGSAATTSALTASDGLLKTVDGEEDG